MTSKLNTFITVAFLLSNGLECRHSRGAAAETTSSKLLAEKPWPDPKRFENKIASYEVETTAPKGAIVGYGSSSMGGWHKTIQEDLKPLTIVPRGFGGSNMNDALYFMDRVLTPLKPRAVLLYEGDNDVASGHSTEDIAGKFHEFVRQLHKSLPETRLYIMSVKPSISRWQKWPAMQQLNAELKKIADTDPLVTYIDIGTPMLGADGKPRENIFLSDKLHMNKEGYVIWKDTVRPVLLEKEAQADAKENKTN